MRVKAIMKSPAITVCATAPLAQAITLLGSGGSSGVAVVDSFGQLCGILSEGDLLRRIELGTAATDDPWWSRLFSSHSPAEAYNKANGRRVEDVMTWAPITIGADDSLSDAARLMEKHRIKRLPVMHEGCLVGMLSRADFIDALRHFVAPSAEKPAVLDGDIQKRIMVAISNERWSSTCGLDISVKDGRVSLNGVVPDKDHQMAARIACENVVGVLGVDERLVVVQALPFLGHNW